MTDKPTITQGDREALDEAVMECVLGDLINGQVIIAKHRESSVAELQAEVERLREALGWYGEQARLCRLIHDEGDLGRSALDADGGLRARAALAQKEPVE